MTRRQTTSHILMIRPGAFGFNPETADSNAFQSNETDLTREEIQQRALREFDTMVEKLRAHGITVQVHQDDPSVPKPDAVFPNNWFTTHATGAIVTYPLMGASRRAERVEAVLDRLNETYKVSEIFRLEEAEQEERYLEGTGSIIMDRRNRIAYACISPRTHELTFHAFCKRYDLEPVSFTSVGSDGTPVYHTNVMMSVGNDFVVICLDSIPKRSERDRLLKIFKRTEKEVVEISLEQMNQFAGNMLQVHNREGVPYLVLSQAAYDSLTTEQIEQLSARTELLPVAIPTIEKFGGGSARCMMAEIFLPKK